MKKKRVENLNALAAERIESRWIPHRPRPTSDARDRFGILKPFAPCVSSSSLSVCTNILKLSIKSVDGATTYGTAAAAAAHPDDDDNGSSALGTRRVSAGLQQRWRWCTSLSHRRPLFSSQKKKKTKERKPYFSLPTLWCVGGCAATISPPPPFVVVAFNACFLTLLTNKKTKWKRQTRRSFLFNPFYPWRNASSVKALRIEGKGDRWGKTNFILFFLYQTSSHLVLLPGLSFLLKKYLSVKEKKVE